MKRAERRGMYLGNSLLAQWGLRPFIECVVEVIVTSDHINAPLTWVPVLHLLLLSSKSDLCPEFVWAVVINKAPAGVMWREEQLLNFNVSTPKSLSFQSLLFIVWRDLWGHYFHPCVETPSHPVYRLVIDMSLVWRRTISTRVWGSFFPVIDFCPGQICSQSSGTHTCLIDVASCRCKCDETSRHSAGPWLCVLPGQSVIQKTNYLNIYVFQCSL